MFVYNKERSYVMTYPNSYSISRVFNAKPQMIFDVVTDFNNYENWNTLIPSAKGNLNIGDEIRMVLKLNGRKRPFSPKVTFVDKNLSFTLTKKILLKQLGELNHKFEFYPLDNGTTELRQTWTGSGMLIKLLWPLIKRSFAEFEIFNDNLYKHLQEQNVGVTPNI